MQWTSALHRPTAACPRWQGWATLWLVLALLWAGTVPAAQAQSVPPAELTNFELTRAEDGLHLAFSLSFDLPRGVEEALQKGVPLYFVANVEIYRDRWYWRDKRLATVERTWRVTYQPLTRKYRVSFGGLNQSYDSLPDALVSVRRVTSWKLLDPGALDGNGHYVEFSYRLDTSLLPRPLQIGLGGQADWNLRVERTQRID